MVSDTSKKGGQIYFVSKKKKTPLNAYEKEKEKKKRDKSQEYTLLLRITHPNHVCIHNHAQPFSPS
jgi:hypothetical protein